MLRLSLLSVTILGLFLVSSGKGQEKPPGTFGELPSGVRLRLGSDRFRIASFFGVSAISSDGKEIAAFGGASEITIFDTVTARKIRSFPVSELLRQYQFFYTQDGKKLVSAGISGINVWDAQNGKKISNIPPFDKTRGNSTFCLSGDGKTVSVWSSIQTTNIKIMLLNDGTELGTVKPLHNLVPYAALSHDGTLIATWGMHSSKNSQDPAEIAIQRSVHIWDVKTAKLISTIDTESATVASARFSPDGKIIAVNVAGAVQLWDLSTGKILKHFAGRISPGQPAQMVFSPDGKVLSTVFARGSVHTWEIESGKRISQFQLPINSSPNVHFRSDGTLLAWGVDNNSLLMWEAASGKTLSKVGGHRTPPSRLVFTRDGKHLDSYTNEGYRIRWDVASGQELLSEKPLNGNYQVRGYTPIFSPDGKYFVGTCNDSGGAAIWDATSNEQLFSLVGSNGTVDRNAVFAFSPDSKRIMALSRNYGRESQSTLPVWEVESGLLLPTLKGPQGNFTMAAFSTNGTILTTCGFNSSGRGGNEIEVFSRDIHTGKLVSKIQLPSQIISQVIYLDHRRFMLLYANGAVSILDALSGKEVQKLDRTGESLTSLFTLSPDRRLIAMVMDAPVQARPGAPMNANARKLLIWESASGSVRHEFEIPSLPTAMAFSPDHRTLAVGLTDTMILLYDLDKSITSKPTSGSGIESHWKALEDRPATAAWDSMLALIAKSDESVPLIKSKLLATESLKPDTARIAKWIAELDSPRFAVRENAMKELGQNSADAEALIKAELEKKTISLETRERLEKLTKGTGMATPETGILRPLRAIEILERINNPAAEEHLKSLAAGRDSTVTRAARDALARMNGK